MRVASVTGHRKLTKADTARVWAAMKALVHNPTIDAVYFGGASGTDTEALRAALEYRPAKVRLVVVVPDTIEAQHYLTREWTRKADEVIELKNPITSDDRYASYKVRNQYLVDVASLLIAFFNDNRRTGTWHAMQCATRKQIPIHIIPVSPV